MVDSNEKVGELTHGQLMKGIAKLLDEKLEEKFNQKLDRLVTKEDLEQLSGKVTELTKENLELKQEILHLKEQGKCNVNKLIDLESRSRRNNLIFQGLKFNENTKDFRSVVERFCNEVFGAAGSIRVNRAHLLGRDRKAIIAHIPNDCDIDYIMSRVKVLKGTGYAVYKDLPAEIRHKRACLAAVRSEVEKVAGRRRMPIIFDRLVIDGCRFTWEDGRLKAGREDGAEKLQELFKHDFKDYINTLARRSSRPTQRSASSEEAGDTVGPGGQSVTSATLGTGSHN